MLSQLEFEKDEKICRLKNFPAPHFFTTALAGNMSAKHGNPIKVERNIDFMLANDLPLNAKIVTISPEHSDKILFAPRHFCESREIECDGLFTFLPNVALVLKPADCFPIFMTSIARKKPRFVGLVHAGWEGTNKEIARKAVESAVRYFPIEPEDIFVGIGPGIDKGCYDNEPLAEELSEDNRWKPFIKDGPLGKRIDLLDFNVKQLLESGIKRENITIATSCTYCAKSKKWDYLFFSHHRWLKNGQVGPDRRFAAVISKF